MTGAEYIVEFLNQRGCKKVFLLTGGACAFVVDAIARHPDMSYVCFCHEQAAAMAADAIWRVSQKVGVTLATSGPGATNLITGIACSYFDSIPSIHITGQVNKAESAAHLGANVRQAGFQETKIVDMVRPITKYAVQVNTVAELKRELTKAYNLAITGRMGPVLIDVPMNVQKEEAGSIVEYTPPMPELISLESSLLERVKNEMEALLRTSQRPLILFGAGVGLAGVQARVVQWIEAQKLPFVSSWNGMSYFNHDSSMYCGQIGVYGNRGANYILQNCDLLLVFGSRLDNRQRSGNPKHFSSAAQVYVMDVDPEELKKYSTDGYFSAALNLKNLPPILETLECPEVKQEWLEYVAEIKERYFNKVVKVQDTEPSSLSPYEVIKVINRMIKHNAIVVVDTGATLCWIYQAFHRTHQTLFTAGGNSPMGYSLPAAIGACLQDSSKQIVCFIGDGGFQLNIQELQTIYHYHLNIKIVVLNNNGYGIIKQFQDSYLNSRYEASGNGYSCPDLCEVAKAYRLNYARIDHLDQLASQMFDSDESILIDVVLDPNTLITPKLEMDRPIHDQFPYVPDEEFEWANRFVRFERKTEVFTK